MPPPNTATFPEARPIGATGNNLTNPALDPVPGTPELKIAPPNFSDANRGLVAGPNARTISDVVSAQPDGVSAPDPSLSAIIYGLGQFVDHDLDLETTAGGADISVPVPPGDPNLPDGTVIPLSRALADPTTGTVVNTVAGFLDLSQVYGSDTTTAASLRNADGSLKTSAGNALPIVNGQFVSGDVRVMENPELVAMTTLFMREHNRIVAQLSAQNKALTGDQLYDQARTINIAEYQHVIYSEWLPALIGQQAAGTFTGYNPAANAEVTQEFSTSAFRVGHSQVSNEQTGIDNQGNQIFTQSLASAFFNAPAQDVSNGIDALLRNMPNDDSQATDVLAVTGLRNLLFAPPDAIDLIAIDVQRERDVGIGTLNETRAALGLPVYTSFDQITSDPTVAAKLQQTFGTVDNVDLFIGGLAEAHVGGGVVGQTFQAIIADQFSRLRAGDRFFWENENLDPHLKATIATTTLGDIIARNTDTNVFQSDVLVSAERHLSNVAAEDPSKPQLVIGTDDKGATIAGGPADDTIVAGLGKDQVLTGGAGADTFTFIHDHQQDTISDFQPGVDKIRFTLDAKDFHINAAPKGGGSVIHWGNDQITVARGAPSSFSMNDFILPGGSDAVLKIV